MSTFFKQLIDLGEDKPAEKSSSGASDLGNLQHAELLKFAEEQRARAHESAAELAALRQESLSLRTEYDGYKNKVSAWQRQIREARDSDKKLIEELRAAGAAGAKTDDVITKTLNETVAKYKEDLRTAREEVEKAFRKQREAEDARAAIELSKKREVEELLGKFETLRAQAKGRLEQQQHQQQQQLNTAGVNGSLFEHAAAENAAQKQQLELELQQRDAQLSALQASLRAHEEEVASLRAALVARSHSTPPHEGGGSSDANGAAVAANQGEQPGAQDSERDAHAAAAASAATAELKHTLAELASCRTKLAVAQAAAATTSSLVAQHRAAEQRLTDELRRQEEAAARRFETLQWESLETDKKLAEAKLCLDASNARVAMLEGKLDARESEAAVHERDVVRAQRALQDQLEAADAKHAAEKAQWQQREAAQRDEAQRAAERAARHSELVGQAEQASHRTAEALEQQRQHFEARLAALEGRLRAEEAAKAQLEALLRDARESGRQRDDITDELRRELDAAAGNAADLEGQLLFLQRSVGLREEELLARERERQSLRDQLRAEEQQAARVRQSLGQLEAASFELQRDLNIRGQQAAELAGERARLAAELQLRTADADGHAATLEQQQRHIAELSARLEELGRRVTDTARVRDDYAATIRVLEARTAELERGAGAAMAGGAGGGDASRAVPNPDGGASVLGLSPVVGAAAGAASPFMPMVTLGGGVGPALGADGGAGPSNYSSGGAGRRMPRYGTSDSHGSRSALWWWDRMSWGQKKTVVTAAIFSLLFVSLYSSFFSTPGKDDGETLLLVHQKYKQTLQALEICLATSGPAAAAKIA